jgi:hypothetical protein
MNSTTKHILFALAFISGIVYFTGCGKVNNSVAGQWNLNAQEAIAKTVNNTLYDSTLYYPIASTFTTSSDGTYALIVPNAIPEYGNWVQNGNTMLLTRTSPTALTLSYNILAVSTHAMTLQRNDTTSRSPLVYIDRIYSYSR